MQRQGFPILKNGLQSFYKSNNLYRKILRIKTIFRRSFGNISNQRALRSTSRSKRENLTNLQILVSGSLYELPLYPTPDKWWCTLDRVHMNCNSMLILRYGTVRYVPEELVENVSECTYV
jgi:hypothetical protein